MRNFFLFLLFISYSFLFSQEKKNNLSVNSESTQESDTTSTEKKIVTIDMYRIISLERDTTYIDTSLTIKKKYSHNYLRKDLFGLLALPNEGQPYNTLQYSLTNFSPFPEFGFEGKHFNFLQANDVRYASVATPVTELYFKSVMQRGQNLDSFLAININPRLNFTISYKGLRSDGNYTNELTSSGNFKFTTSFHTKNIRYLVNAHYVGQDILNEENGGITNIEDFEQENPAFIQRERMGVYLTDAESLLKAKRFFVDHIFRINSIEGENNLFVFHQFNFENKFFDYLQPTVNTNIGGKAVTRYGDSYRTSGISDKTKYNRMYNKLGLIYENKTLGKFSLFLDDYVSNYFYNQILVLEKGIIWPSLTRRIDTYCGQYDYRKNKWTGKFLFNRSFTDQSLSHILVKMKYELNDEMIFSFKYQNMNKLPNDNYNLHQSSYINYNWSNNFKNEKINSLEVNAQSPWGNVSLQYSIFNDHLYFNEVSSLEQKALRQIIVAPSQYNGTINYLSIKANNELKFGKFALDNTLLFQKVSQSDQVLNVPELVTRNTIYFSQDMFRKALYFQTGVTFNYFTSYFGNEYNPVIGEFFVQNQKKIGNYSTFDFFFNARIQRTRIYLTLEHFNASFSGNNNFSTPNVPYSDFIIRFGLVWNFFN